MNFFEIQKLHEKLNRQINPISTILDKIDLVNRLLPQHNFDIALKSQGPLSLVSKINIAVGNQLKIYDFGNIFEDNIYFNAIKRIETINAASAIIDKIQNSFKAISYDLSDCIEDFEDEVNEEDGVKNIILTETSRIKQILFEIYCNNEKLFTIHPREFEKIVAELLYQKGFKVELTKQTRDNGYDILAMKYIDGLSPIKYLVECKRNNINRKIGVEIIRSFKDVILTEQANKGIIVTTSYFSKQAIIKQKETPFLLDYKDKDDIMEWISNYAKQINRS